LVRSSPPSSEFETTFQQSYELYKKYQMTIHGESESDCAEKSFKRFLVTSPLQADHSTRELDQGFGSFHQQYWLDGNKLIAVGIVDILPNCVSSVYLYYDPEFSFLSLGTYTALREINFVCELNRVCPQLRYYYMGYYIHSCPKMRYKGQYHPSYLLCPETYTWQPIRDCKSKLDVSKYSRLETNPDNIDKNFGINIGEASILHNRSACKYSLYRAIVSCRDIDDEEEIEEYCRLVGNTCAKRMLLYRE